MILGPQCVSACDQFASILVDNDIAAMSVGLPTAGASAPYRVRLPLRLEHDTELRLEVTVGVDYRPIKDKKGSVPLEGNPVEPKDKLLPRTGDRGAYLSEALKKIYAELNL